MTVIFIGFTRFSFLLCCFLDFVSSKICESPGYIRETAYDGAYVIRFPERRNNTFVQPRHCKWNITTYRKDYVVHLSFEEVNLHQDVGTHACIDVISVYNGFVLPDVVAHFCGTEDQDIVVQSEKVQIRFITNNTSLDERKFRLRYKAVRKPHNENSGQILRTTFGVLVGFIALTVALIAIFRKHKQVRPNSPFLLFCRHCSNLDHGSAANNTRAGGQTRATQGAESETLTFRKRVAGFFQGFKTLFTQRRLLEDTSTADSSSGTTTLPPYNQQVQQRGPPAVLQGRNANIGNYDSEIDIPAVAQYNAYSANTGYQTLPVSSFTSDPDAVRPPAYEDCINNVNPLYLHHHGGQAFYNRALDLKDEEDNRGQFLSPPPPYTEICDEVPNPEPTPAEGGANQPAGSVTEVSTEPPPWSEFPPDGAILVLRRGSGDVRARSGSTAHSTTGDDSMTPVSVTQEQ